MDSILDSVGEIVTSLVTIVTDSIQGFIDIFYTADTGITVLGYLGLIGLGISFTMLGLKFVKRLFKG